MQKKLKIRKTKVAVYARVSTSKDAQIHSLHAQLSYYQNLIQNNPEYEYVDIYYDEGISGTKVNRPAFNKMIEDAKSKKFDMIITKSISRFARNTVTLLENVRLLKRLDIDVFFEEQNIHTLSSEGEFMLSLLASIAQEESLQVSENSLWRIKKNFENGIPWAGRLLGYKMDKDKFVIVEDEAKIVRRIFNLYLENNGLNKIAKILNEEKLVTRNLKLFTYSSIRQILKNYTYTGNLLLQKTFVDNHITKKKKVNNGEKPMYHVENSHEAIIDKDTFNKVQAKLNEKKDKYYFAPKNNINLFKSKLRCPYCNKYLVYKTNKNKPYYLCSTFSTLGKEVCNAKKVPEEILKAKTMEVLKVDDLTSDSLNKIDVIEVNNDNTLTFKLVNGEVKTISWSYPSRSKSWNEEMKERARIKTKERYTYGR